MLQLLMALAISSSWATCFTANDICAARCEERGYDSGAMKGKKCGCIRFEFEPTVVPKVLTESLSSKEYTTEAPVKEKEKDWWYDGDN